MRGETGWLSLTKSEINTFWWDQGWANFPINFVVSEAELLLLFGSNVQFGSNEQSTSKRTSAVTVSFRSWVVAPGVGVATRVETTVSPAARVEYSQKVPSGLTGSQFMETTSSWSGKKMTKSTAIASSGPRFVMVAVY